MKLKSRLLLSFIIVALLAVGIGIISNIYALHVKRDADRLFNISLVDIEQSQAINFLLQRAKSNVREAQVQRYKENVKAEKYAIDEVRYALSKLHFRHQAWQRQLKQGIDNTGGSTDRDRQALKSLAELGDPLWVFIHNSFALLSLLESADPHLMDAEQEFQGVYASWLQQSRSLQSLLDKRVTHAREDIDVSSKSLRSSLSTAQQAYLWVHIIFLFLTLLIAYTLIRSITKPLNHLSQYAEQLTRFNFNSKPNLKRDDEFSKLGGTLSLLANEIQRQHGMMAAEIEQRKLSEHDARHLYEFNQMLLNSVADGIFGIRPDGVISFINQSARTLLADKTHQLLGQPYNQSLSFVDMDSHTVGQKSNSKIDDILYGQSVASSRAVAKLDTLAGQILYVEYEATALQQDGEFAGVVVIFRDYTLKFNYEQELRLTAQVFDTLSEAIIVTDSQNHCIKVNPAFTLITGLSENEVLSQKPNCIFTEHHTQLFYKTLWHNLHSDGVWQGEIWSKRANGEMFPAWVKISVIKHRAEISHHVITFFDISEQKEAQKQVKFLSMRDPLTGIPNRTLFQNRLRNRLLGAEKSQRQLALLIVDLNHFKEINNQFGLVAGDELLKDVAAALGRVLSPQDTLARLGGDEFALVVPYVDHQYSIEEKVAKVRSVFDHPFDIAGEQMHLGFAIGVAVYPDNGLTEEALNNSAQFALQQAKKMSEKVCYFHQDMNLAIEHKKMLTKALNLAIANNDLRLFYQPKVLPDTGEIIGFEALIRWQHATLGFISPADFIPIAEETGLIEPLGEWIILEAARQAGEWVKMGYSAIKVAVNLSPKQFVSARLAHVISESISCSQIEPFNLELEITESMLMENVEAAILVMEQFSQQGINISLDDFGTGYSSLSYLKRFPIHTLKIDRSFVAQLSSDNDDAKIVSTIITMAHTLGLEVVAEGVETKEQMQFLQGRHCDQLQGYYFSRPVSAKEATELLMRNFLNLI